MDVVSVIKTHPLPIAAGVAVLLLLMAASRGGSASSGNGAAVAASLQSQSIATQGNTSVAAINADVFKTSLSANAQAAQQRTALIGSIFNSEIATSAQLSAANISATTQKSLAFMAHQDNQKALDNQLTLGRAQLDASTAQGAAKLDTALKLSQMSSNTQLQALSLSLQGNHDQAAQMIQGQKDMLGMNIDYAKSKDAITAANLPTLLQHSENLSKIAASNAQAIASINTTAQVTAAKAAATQSYANTGMDILGSLGSLFGGSGSSGGGDSGGGGFSWGDAASIAAAIFA